MLDSRQRRTLSAGRVSTQGSAPVGANIACTNTADKKLHSIWTVNRLGSFKEAPINYTTAKMEYVDTESASSQYVHASPE